MANTNKSIDLGVLQSNFLLAKSNHTAACTIREKARAALRSADEKVLMRETDLDEARTALAQAVRIVTKE